MTTKRNQPCPCGSGKKYNRCCALLDKDLPASPQEQACSLVDQGNLQLRQGQLIKARDLYLDALNVEPQYFRAHYNLGVVLRKLGQNEDAAASYQKALLIEPGDYETHYNLGVVLRDLGAEEDAAASFRKALDLKPESAETHYNLAITLRDLGKLEDALASSRKAINLKPDYAKSHLLIASLQKYSGNEEHILEMENLFSQHIITSDQKMHLAFALGKAHEDSGNYEKAFYYLEEGNKLKRNTYEYSMEETEAEFKMMKRTFTKSFILNNSKSGIPDSTPIFILGMPRSGTSLVEHILASHPDVYGAGERPFIANIISQLTQREQTYKICEKISTENGEFIASLGPDYIEKIRKLSTSAKFITDKMPHNFYWIGAIILAFPNAKIISCLRNPMDNCLSIYKNLFQGTHKFAYDLRELARYHLLYQDLMRYWYEVFPGKIYDISYEKLVGDQEAETNKLLQHCNLPWDDACLSFHKTSRAVSTASAAQVRKPIYKDSVQLWKRYEKHLQPLSEILSGKNGG